MLVGGIASTRLLRWRRNAGAAMSPTNAELPAPVRMIRRSGRSRTSRRKPVTSSSDRPATSRHAPGCWPISRIVAPPFCWVGMPAWLRKEELVIGTSGGQGAGTVVCGSARICVGPQRVAYSVEDQGLREGFQVAGPDALVLARQELADERERNTNAVEVGQQRPARGIDPLVGPVVAQPVTVAVSAGGALR